MFERFFVEKTNFGFFAIKDKLDGNRIVVASKDADLMHDECDQMNAYDNGLIRMVEEVCCCCDEFLTVSAVFG